MVVTELPMITDSNDSHPEKVSSPMVETESGIVMDSNPHSSKALSPIVVTESGMVMLANDLHRKKT